MSKEKKNRGTPLLPPIQTIAEKDHYLKLALLPILWEQIVFFFWLVVKDKRGTLLMPLVDSSEGFETKLRTLLLVDSCEGFETKLISLRSLSNQIQSHSLCSESEVEIIKELICLAKKIDETASSDFNYTFITDFFTKFSEMAEAEGIKDRHIRIKDIPRLFGMEQTLDFQHQAKILSFNLKSWIYNIYINCLRYVVDQQGIRKITISNPDLLDKEHKEQQLLFSLKMIIKGFKELNECLFEHPVLSESLRQQIKEDLVYPYMLCCGDQYMSAAYCFSSIGIVPDQDARSLLSFIKHVREELSSSKNDSLTLATFWWFVHIYRNYAQDHSITSLRKRWVTAIKNLLSSAVEDKVEEEIVRAVNSCESGFEEGKDVEVLEYGRSLYVMSGRFSPDTPDGERETSPWGLPWGSDVFFTSPVNGTYGGPFQSSPVGFCPPSQSSFSMTSKARPPVTFADGSELTDYPFCNTPPPPTTINISDRPQEVNFGKRYK